MSKYSTLKAEIIASIKRNGAQAITGDLLQEKLLAMIDSLGEFYQFGGLALPSTEFTPGDEPVVFIAATPGTYTNFGGIVVADGEVAILVWNGSAWSKQTTDIATRSEVSQLGQDLYSSEITELPDLLPIDVNYTDKFVTSEPSNYLIERINRKKVKITHLTSFSTGNPMVSLDDLKEGTYIITYSGNNGLAFYKDNTFVSNLLPNVENTIMIEEGHDYELRNAVEQEGYYENLFIKSTFDALSELKEKVTQNETDINDLEETKTFVDEELKSLIIGEDITGTIYTNVVINPDTGAESSYGSATASDYIAVQHNKVYFITASMAWGYALYVIYDSNKHRIAGRQGGAGSTVITMNKEPITMPSNAAYIKVCYWSATEMGVVEESIVKSSANMHKCWGGLKWAAMGDSLTQVNNAATLRYHDYVAEMTGISVVNLGVGGTGYARGGDYNFYNRVSTIPNDCSIITIFGSGNDAGASLPIGDVNDSGDTSLCGYINRTITEIQTLYPLVPFGIITPTPWQGFEPNERTGDNWFEDYSNAIVAICKLRGVPCLDLYHCSNLHPSNADFRAIAYSHDGGGGTHPDENGHKIIAPRFEAFLKTLLLN